MNTAELLTHVPPPPALARRVRIVNDPRVVGTVIDVDPNDGWLMWVDDAHGCHFSHPSYVEAAS